MRRHHHDPHYVLRFFDFAAFRQLYDVESRLSQKSQSQVDAEQRKLEDYVFAPLDYSHSMTCCWDSSTSAMYDLIMQKAMADKAAADAQHVCMAPTVFAAQNGGYQLWADFASAQGRGAEWKAYHDDEDCTARNVTADTEATSNATPYCSM